MTTVVKAAGAAEFLALVPRLLGYTAVRSAVLVPTARGRSLGAMRLDLPPDDPAMIDMFASTAVGFVCRVPDVDAFVVVVYTDEPIGDALPFAPLVAALRLRAAASGLTIVDALVVAGDGWGSHDDPDLPPHGRPLAEIVTRMPSGQAALPADQASGAALPPHSAAERRRVGAAMRSLRTSLEVLCGIPGGPHTERVDPAALEAACALDDLPRLIERALAWAPDDLPAMDAALIGWCLARPSLRDVALVQWAGDIVDGEDALDAQRRWEDGEEYPADLAAVMWGEGRRPDPERLGRALELSRHVAALLSVRQRPGPLAVCAWLSWALGRSTHAERYAQLAQEIDPEHGLADIIRSFVAAGHLPDWAFHRRPGIPLGT
ncbi:DUF4192 domain-containing protein [Microbacterium sp. W1N]|uniref:DUF4192 domain-containing protein n=1 Tax=Microbacterium festucae TaxID=2977531 RepID=UPI0021BF8914|nr:DUF4192 domain-containing protein [Microbacterium festucae]MCT9819199.1 DUF4192 domain-containing protein [Microbacterium festucae]